MVLRVSFLLTFIFLLLGNASTYKKTIKVAIVDTGLNIEDIRFKDHLCPEGHKNFVYSEPLDDINGHGTHIAGLIQKYAGNSNYCLLIYKFHQEGASGATSLNREIMAINEAIRNGADIINLSEGGPEFDEQESLIIKNHPEVIFVVAAGNSNRNIDIPNNGYYPASLFYKNMVIVGSMDSRGNRSKFSNYSKKIKIKELGEEIESYLPKGKGKLSGTSQSTATYTGKLINKLSKLQSRSENVSKFRF